MKKIIMFLLFSVLILALGIYSCTKENNQRNNVDEMSVKIENQGTIVSDFVPAGVNCIVPTGFTSCNSSCTFSECCVVWDPTKETGGCGCFFGISTCKTRKIGEEKSSQILPLTSKRTTIIHQDKLNEFFKFCADTGIKTSAIENSKLNKLIPGIIKGDSKNAIVEAETYDMFIEDYKLFIASLSILN